MPTDSKITIGKLDNGLKYYIRENNEPQNRAELRLVINVGSIMEDEDQLGLAHFVEHMAFNGTESFEKDALVNYLESIGMRFGPDLNAYTSFDETVYMLQIPTDSVEIIQTAFQILEEWAHRVSFDDAEIEKERGVVVEEWRLGRGASARMLDQQLPVLFKDSRYAERLPIGKKNIIETAAPETIRKFYKDWYRPNLMAVLAVGDFDKDEIEQQIRTHFQKLKNPKDERPRAQFPVPDHDETLVAIATDPEATYTSVSINYKKDVGEEDTHRAYRESLIKSIYNGILNNRLGELLQQPEPPFRYAAVGEGRLIRNKELYSMTAVTTDDALNVGLEALLTEAERTRRFGVTKSELERQKTAMLSQIEQAYREIDNWLSADFAAEYIRNFLQDEPIPGLEYEYFLWKEYIPEITLKEVNAYSSKLLEEKNRVILVNAPENATFNLPTEAEMLETFAIVKAKELEPYVEDVSDAPLIENLPAPGTVVERTYFENVDVYRWTLSNGAKVFFKITAFKNDELLFNAFSPGGNGLYNEADYVPAITASSLASLSGLGDFDRIELTKKLTGNTASVNTYISELSEGLSGSTSPQDLETLFQLIYLQFQTPREDSTAFLAFQSQIRGFLENRNADPANVFGDTVSVTMSKNHYRSQPFSEETLTKMDLKRSYEIFNERFSNAEDFTFIFVGNIDSTALKTYATKYLAVLPGYQSVETWKDPQVPTLEEAVEKTVYRGLEPQAEVQLYFNGVFDWNFNNRTAIDAMASVLQIKLRESLREDQGGTYGVGVNAQTERFPKENFQVQIGFGCAPERVEELVNLVYAEIERMKNGEITDEDVQKIKESNRRTHELRQLQNSFWLSNIRFYLWNDLPIEQILDKPLFIENVSKEMIQNAAKSYLNVDKVAKFVLMPEDGGW